MIGSGVGRQQQRKLCSQGAGSLAALLHKHSGPELASASRPVTRVSAPHTCMLPWTMQVAELSEFSQRTSYMLNHPTARVML